MPRPIPSKVGFTSFPATFVSMFDSMGDLAFLQAGSPPLAQAAVCLQVVRQDQCQTARARAGMCSAERETSCVVVALTRLDWSSARRRAGTPFVSLRWPASESYNAPTCLRLAQGVGGLKRPEPAKPCYSMTEAGL